MARKWTVAIHVEQDVMLDSAETLRHYALGLRIVGMDKLANNLDDIARDLDQGRRNIDTALKEHTNELLQQTYQATGNMLAAALAVAEIKGKELGTLSDAEVAALRTEGEYDGEEDDIDCGDDEDPTVGYYTEPIR